MMEAVVAWWQMNRLQNGTGRDDKKEGQIQQKKRMEERHSQWGQHNNPPKGEMEGVRIARKRLTLDSNNEGVKVSQCHGLNKKGLR